MFVGMNFFIILLFFSGSQSLIDGEKGVVAGSSQPGVQSGPKSVVPDSIFAKSSTVATAVAGPSGSAFPNASMGRDREAVEEEVSQSGSRTENKAASGQTSHQGTAQDTPQDTLQDADQSADISVQGNWLSYSDLMSDSYPAKSRVVYLKAYKLFERFLKSKNQWTPNIAPTDLQVLNYFYYLRNELKWAPTTLWSTYARINAVMKRLYGISLNSFKRVSDVLKSYESGHIVKQAGIFTPQQIEDFVTDPELSSKYWLVRKVVCLIGYYGGFRNIELKSLKFENCEKDAMGYWFTFERSKQRGRLEATSICVPRRQPDWIPVTSDCSRVGLDFDPASVIDLYLAEIQHDLQCSQEDLKGDFFRASHGKNGQKFTKLTLGKNTIGRVGVQVATELCLPRPETFTGHCWRRSCGTSASDSGVNVTTLMSMMGWSNPKTAMVYVKKSRMTSLSLSLYLANVQRSNCSNPFPRSPLEKRLSVKQTQKVKSEATKVEVSSGVNASISVAEFSGSVSKIEDQDLLIGTQDLIREIEAEETKEKVEQSDDSVLLVEPELDFSDSSSVAKGVREDSGSVERGESETLNQIPLVDPRMAGILHNLRNSGNITINFNFDRK